MIRIIPLLIIGTILTTIVWVIPYCVARYRKQKHDDAIPAVKKNITLPWVRWMINETIILEQPGLAVLIGVCGVWMGGIVIPACFIFAFGYSYVGKPLHKGYMAALKKFGLTKEEKIQIALGTTTKTATVQATQTRGPLPPQQYIPKQCKMCGSVSKVSAKGLCPACHPSVQKMSKALSNSVSKLMADISKQMDDVGDQMDNAFKK